MRQIKNILFFFLFAFQLNAQWEITSYDKTVPDTLLGNQSRFLGILTGVDCPNSQDCYALGNYRGYVHPVVFKSIDAGVNWQVSFYKPSESFNYLANLYMHNISAPTKKFCIIAGDSGVVFRTIDEGKNWQRVNTKYYLDKNLKSISSLSMYDSLYGVVSNGRTILKTSDGGITWVEITNLPKPNGTFDLTIPTVSMLSDQKIIYYQGGFVSGGFDGLKQEVVISEDFGKSWISIDVTKFNEDAKTYFTQIYPIDKNQIIIIGGEQVGETTAMTQKVIKSTDGGYTWKSVINKQHFSKTNLQLMNVSFNKNKGIAITQIGKMLFTNDFGETWFIKDTTTSNINTNSYKICWRNLEEPIMSTYVGIILKRNSTTHLENEIYNSNNLIFPNPTPDFINLNEVGSYEIYSMIGEKISTGESFNGKLNVTALPKGIYFVSINGKVNKFVKE
jgi:photosystem II stability/assembly factor-like uncharacterized protein